MRGPLGHDHGFNKQQSVMPWGVDMEPCVWPWGGGRVRVTGTYLVLKFAVEFLQPHKSDVPSDLKVTEIGTYFQLLYQAGSWLDIDWPLQGL